MSASTVLCRLFGQKALDLTRFIAPSSCQVQQIRDYWKPKNVPQPGIKGKSYRRIVHFKDKYTIQPLEVTNLGGRDPVTGRVVCIGIGGGLKHKYHWIKWLRTGPKDINEKPKEEKVLKILFDGCRTSHLALIGSGKELYYILATINMKEGDIIKTHMGIPRIPVIPNEGDCYTLGALPVGTIVNCVEKYPGLGGFLIHSAGTFGTIIRKEEDRVIVKVPSKKEFSLLNSCMATVGRLSNEMHSKTPIGSPNASRWLGNRPRSGLWHRKTGKHGRKIKPLPPVKQYNPYAPKSDDTIQLSLSGFM
ncbi:large ribosomal subunit protein uL2m [Phymastichus coffea]|uniref:large ribosomal subunit protein uL2m n=1 Tax=Phymastichus coffea TaxID=108790 RepID=UPI00273C839E|nr:large ribosomal subunit protein uL2m [Phymastichus coffea]